MADISICIPTYNRAAILDKTLQHLAEIDSMELEVVISDNDSSDETSDIVKKYENSFSRFHYHRQSENIGAPLNVQTALSLATSKLLYILSDDDRIVPDTFRKIIGIFNQHPSLVAVYGNHCEFDPVTGHEYEMYRLIEEEAIYTPENRVDMFEKFGQLWGPIFRTDVFQRHVYFDDTTFGYWRTIEMLFKHGSIAVIPDLIYKHAQTVPRFEYNLVEPWYHDMHKSDFELFIAGLNVDYSTPGIMEHIIQLVTDRTVQVYLNAFDFAAQQEKYMLQRHYLLRGKCYNLVSQEQLVEWEENFILHCALERLEIILQSHPEVDTIYIESSSMTEYLCRIKEQKRFSSLPKMQLVGADTICDKVLADNEILLTMAFETIAQRKHRKQGHEFSLLDIITTIRVTSGDLNIQSSG